MSKLRIGTVDGRVIFNPGEKIQAVAEWQLDAPADAVELRLLWFTRGNDDDESANLGDVQIVDQTRLNSPAECGAEQWMVQLPNGPYSFTGSLFSLTWALEIVAEPTEKPHRLEIIVAPHDTAILLHPQTDGDDSA